MNKMPRVVPPPPTRYSALRPAEDMGPYGGGVQRAMQAKPASAMPVALRSEPRPSVAPPPVRYGASPMNAPPPATGLLQRKLVASAPPTPRAMPGLVVQCMQMTVNLSTTVMSPEYQELMRIWFSYSRDDGYNYGAQVTKDFKIATKLGIAAYNTDNHASDGSGGPGEGQKALEERGNYLNWRKIHEGQLDSVTIASGGGKKEKYHVTQEEIKIHSDNKQKNKRATATSKHDQYHSDNNLAPAVYLETKKGTKCTVCNAIIKGK